MLTKAGIENNLKASPYRATFEGVSFVFSSKLHMDKFICERLINQERIDSSLSKRFKFTIVNPLMDDIALYIKIETRGFLIQNAEGDYLTWDNLILSGAKVMKKH